MPEGPEVKLSADLIRPLLINKTVKNVKPALEGRYFSENPEGYTPFLMYVKSGKCVIQEIKVRGKFMYWSFGDEWYMFSTFGMTGQWSPKRGKHPSFIFEFDGEEMVFNDPRHFGTIKFVQGKNQLEKKLKELGWDPLSMPLDQNIRWLKHKLSKTKDSIAEALMNQGIFSGVGNYIRAEALYLSKLSPFRPAKKLSEDELKTLCQSIITIMEESYKHQGATIHTYKTAYGEEGKYSTLFKVYGQEKDPLGNKVITQTTPDKRTIHWCPAVQS